MVLQNLNDAISSKSITKIAISQVLGMTEKTLANKINGATDFSVKEALSLKHNFFPEYDFEFLLSDNGKSA